MDQISNTKLIGDISVSYVTAKLLENSLTVLEPRGDYSPYDLVIDNSETFFRIQVKTGRKQNGLIKFAIKGTRGHRGSRDVSYKGRVDYIMVYTPGYNEILCIDVNKVGINAAEWTLRVDSPKNNQVKYINWAKDYHFNPDIFRCSSVVEQEAVNFLAGGSNPSTGAKDELSQA